MRIFLFHPQQAYLRGEKSGRDSVKEKFREMHLRQKIIRDKRWNEQLDDVLKHLASVTTHLNQINRASGLMQELNA